MKALKQNTCKLEKYNLSLTDKYLRMDNHLIYWKTDK